MIEIKDWRGTPIVEGATVLTHSKNWGYGLGIVGQVREKTLTVSLKESNYWTYGPPKTTLVTIPHSVTVLTKDMLDD